MCDWSGVYFFSSTWSVPLVGGSSTWSPKCSRDTVPLPTEAGSLVVVVVVAVGRLLGEGPMGGACLGGWGVDMWHIEIYIL